MSSKLSLEVQSLIDAQDNLFVLIDENYNIVSANKAYQTAYGVSADAIVGRKCHEVSHHSAVPCHMNGEDCPHRRVFTSGKPHQVLHVHYDKQARAEYVRIKASPVFAPDGARYLGESLCPLKTGRRLDTERPQVTGGSASVGITNPNKTVPDTVEPSMKDLESRYIAELLSEYGGRRAKVAEILGISERTLYRKLKRYGLQSVGRTP